MIRGYAPIWQAFLAALFTWGVTALGAAVVFVMRGSSKKLLDVSLGFAAGVMTAASFWSLLAPAIEISEEMMGSFAFLPVAIGFGLGAAFVCLADRLIPACVLSDLSLVDVIATAKTETELSLISEAAGHSHSHDTDGGLAAPSADLERYMTPSASSSHPQAPPTSSTLKKRDVRRRNLDSRAESALVKEDPLERRRVPCMTQRVGDKEAEVALKESWRRIILLILAVTVHNIPEGLAVGVGFASIGKTKAATFESAFNLALGIGLQNFPEGLAVSVPLAAFGHSKLKAFFYGQLSGMVEPVAALLGAAAVMFMEPMLPYALAFAAGAMIFVVVDDIIPEAQRHGNGKLASIGATAGFIVMMSLDVGLG